MDVLCPTCNGTKKVKKEIRNVCLIEIDAPCPDCVVDPVAQGMSVTFESQELDATTIVVGEGSGSWGYTYPTDCA